MAEIMGLLDGHLCLRGIYTHCVSMSAGYLVPLPGYCICQTMDRLVSSDGQCYGVRIADC